MTIRLISTLFGLLAAAWQASPQAPATIVVSYGAVSEGDTSNHGSVSVLLKTGEVRAVVVWESECHLDARANAIAAAPGVDQYWSFKTDFAAGPDGRPGVRVRYQRTRMAAAGPQPPEKEQWLPVDGVTALTVAETSWRKDCKYGRFTMTVTANR
jgi:hypothetical protein